MARDFDFLPSSKNVHPAQPRQAESSHPSIPAHKVGHTSLRDYHPLTPKKPKPPLSLQTAQPKTMPQTLTQNPLQVDIVSAPQPIARQPQPVREPNLVISPRRPTIAPPRVEESRVSQTPKKKMLTMRNILGLLLSLVAMVALSAGLLTPLLQNPHIVVALYIPVALIFKLKSQTSFSIALLLLIAIPLLIVLKQQALAETYAVFCFYFLVLGVIMAALELRTQNRRVL